jgi:hypothetical protein
MKSKNVFISAMVAVSLTFYSCGVQHFNVNTNDSGKGWAVFGENTKGKVLGKDYAKGGDFFIIGINISHTDTKALAEQLNTTAYTIETKANFLSILLSGVTAGIVGYKVVKVIKR